MTMNEEIEYAEMLEIPVSTVNVIKKRRRRKQKTEPIPQAQSETLPPLKDSVIAQVNDKLQEIEPQGEITADAELFAESANSEGSIDFDFPERIDTVRLYSENHKTHFWNRRKTLAPQDVDLENDLENEAPMYALNEKNNEPSRAFKIALNTEFAVACALCGAIFLTNVFMPTSAINTFFRSLNGETAAAGDARSYTEFTLSPVVSELSDTQLSLSPTGILSFTDEACVYPVADGTVKEVIRSADGTYSVKLAYSDLFTGVIGGLDHVYYVVGEEVKRNVPIGYSEGESEVQITMYSEGELLNCFQITEENCLAWISQE